MFSERDCVDFARQCERLAGLCKDDPQLREHLLDLAQEWLARVMYYRRDRERASKATRAAYLPPLSSPAMTRAIARRIFNLYIDLDERIKQESEQGAYPGIAKSLRREDQR